MQEKSERPYHHGDLKRVVIETAQAMLREEKGWQFTLREVARRAGVSHAAPYKHFPDKSALLAELAALGFDALRTVLASAIDPEKDVDGFHPINAGRLASGLPGLVPCTPLGCVMLAKTAHTSLAGLDAVVVGRSNIVGKPVAQLLLAENATVTVAHSKTRDLAAVCRRADLLVGRDCPDLLAGGRDLQSARGREVRRAAG